MDLNRIDLKSETSKILKSWLDVHKELFHPIEPEYVTIANHAFRVQLLYSKNASLIDLGGGATLVNGILAHLGMKVFVVDYMDHYWEKKTVQTDNAKLAFDFLEKQGVKFIKSDLCDIDLKTVFAPGSIDVITTNNAIEHFHHSPQKCLESAVSVLKSGGKFIIEVPNAVNILKRLRVLLGKTNYVDLKSFYFSEPFMGHVREYTKKDLISLAGYLSLSDYRILGRNWAGTLYTKIKNPVLAKTIDRLLRPFPGLCASLFLIARKNN